MLLEEQEELIARGERNPKLNKNDRLKLDKDILPFFAEYNVRDITYKHINDYVRTLADRNLRPTTIKVHLTLINKILSVGLREGIVDRLPPMPKIKVVDSPRGWFSKDEYDLLKKTALKLAEQKEVVRYHPITREMYLLILFMVNTFLRPSDIKLLRHRNVQVVDNEHHYLRIQTDTSKTVKSAVVSMEAAVGIFNEIRDLQQSLDRPTGSEDFVFFPHLPNRDYALQTMRRHFERILDEAQLKRSATGELRTLYSLRHTAIMFRLTMGDHIDLLSLARNARTSVDMIERFYARPLQAEMNVGKIQSMRKPASR
jgi:integrase